MSDHNRRSLIAGGTTLLFGGALASLTSVGARDDDTDASEDDPSENANESGDERMNTSENQPDENEDDGTADELEMSVSATESTSVTEGYADFLVTVTNRGDDSVTVPVILETEHVYDELETLELDPGESGDAYASLEARTLGSGDHDWTVTAGDAVETGTVSVESTDDYDENRDDLELTVHLIDGATVRIQDGDTTARIGCNMTIFNHGDDPVSAVGTFEIADERAPITVDLDGRESTYLSETVELEEGKYEWTVTLDDETETGTLVVC